MLLPISTLALVVSIVSPTRAKNDGLAKTPPMGWNTWNHFGCDINQDVILKAAKAIVETGLKSFGYEYIIIDDCWHAPSRSSSPPYKPVADPIRFPGGIKFIADYVHAHGLKLGIYSSAGTYTCAKQFGSLGFEEIDAKTYAEWGVDYLKYDNCYNEGQAGTDLISYNRYKKMSDALDATGRKMVYAMCNWGEDGTWNWAPTIAHTWRMSGDIIDIYEDYDDRCPCLSPIDCKLPGFHCSMLRILDYSAPLMQKAGVGQWNDMDMLEVGNGGMTTVEYMTHFAMWALLKSPLILGNDLEEMDEITKAIITNQALIKINQDPLGIPVNRVYKRSFKPIVDSSSKFEAEMEGGGKWTNNLQTWSGILEDGAVVAVVNTGKEAIKGKYKLKEVYPAASKTDALKYEVSSLWGLTDPSLGIVPGNFGVELGTYRAGDEIVIEVPEHGCVVHRWTSVREKTEGVYGNGWDQFVVQANL